MVKIKNPLLKTLCSFEGISLTDIQTEKLLNNVNYEIQNFTKEESLIIKNVINTFNYIDALDLSLQNVDLNLYIQYNSILAKDQALSTGSLRNGLSSIPCIGQIPVASIESVQKEICNLNNLTTGNFKRVASECFCNLSKLQPFWDGNKRTTFLLCNTQLLKNDFELLIIKKETYADFEKYLTEFYTKNDRNLIDFLVKNCFVNTETRKSEERRSYE